MSKPKKLRVEFYRDANGQHRWRAKSGNGLIVGASTECYTRHVGAVRGARATLAALARDIDAASAGFRAK